MGISVVCTKTYPKIHFVLKYTLKVSNRHAVFMNKYLHIFDLLKPTSIPWTTNMGTSIVYDVQVDLLYFTGPQENLHLTTPNERKNWTEVFGVKVQWTRKVEIRERTCSWF